MVHSLPRPGAGRWLLVTQGDLDKLSGKGFVLSFGYQIEPPWLLFVMRLLGVMVAAVCTQRRRRLPIGYVGIYGETGLKVDGRNISDKHVHSRGVETLYKTQKSTDTIGLDSHIHATTNEARLPPLKKKRQPI